ncbi:MAG: CoA transferase [Deltaproteobacteria bacterium]|nr:CoA transferase [Deltaproteobacteria bacterium]
MAKVLPNCGERKNLVTGPRTATVAARKVHEALVEQVVEEWAKGHTVREVVALLNAGSIPASPIFSFGDIVQEGHFQARGMVCEVEHPTAGKLTHYGIAPKFSHTPVRVRTPAPLLGQDNAEVYGKWLGCSDTALEELRREGVI